MVNKEHVDLFSLFRHRRQEILRVVVHRNDTVGESGVSKQRHLDRIRHRLRVHAVQNPPFADITGEANSRITNPGA